MTKPGPSGWPTYAAMTAHVAGAAGTYVLGEAPAKAFASPAALTLARGALASVLCLALTGWAVPAPRFSRREWTEIAGLGAILALNQWLFLSGLRQTVPHHAALIYATTPAGVLLATAALERRRPATSWAVGVGAALAGVVLVLEPWNRDDALRDVRSGDLKIGIGLLVWVVYTLRVRRLARAADARTVTVWTLVAGTVLLAPFATGALLDEDLGALPASAWTGVLWLAAVTSTFMMLLWNWMLRHLEPVQVAICANAQPVATGLLLALLVALGADRPTQTLGLTFWAGTALVVAGVVALQRPGDGAGFPAFLRPGGRSRAQR